MLGWGGVVNSDLMTLLCKISQTFFKVVLVKAEIYKCLLDSKDKFRVPLYINYYDYNSRQSNRQSSIERVFNPFREIDINSNGVTRKSEKTVFHRLSRLINWPPPNYATYVSRILRQCTTWSISGYDGYKPIKLPMFNKRKKNAFGGFKNRDLIQIHSLFRDVEMS